VLCACRSKTLSGGLRQKMCQPLPHRSHKSILSCTHRDVKGMPAMARGNGKTYTHLIVCFVAVCTDFMKPCCFNLLNTVSSQEHRHLQLCRNAVCPPHRCLSDNTTRHNQTVATRQRFINCTLLLCVNGRVGGQRALHKPE